MSEFYSNMYKDIRFYEVLLFYFVTSVTMQLLKQDEERSRNFFPGPALVYADHNCTVKR